MKPLKRFLELAQTNSAEGFLEACADSVLVLVPAALHESTGFQTIASQRDAPAEGDMQVLSIRKRRGSNAFTNMITMGRTPNNDLVIKAPGVSKFHAFLQREGDGDGFTITDGGSTYGTRVNGKKLDPRTQKLPLQSGDELQLGREIRLTFYTPAGFYESLMTLR